MTVPAVAAGTALLVLAAAVLCSSATGDEVPAVYVFGDSLVDAGNNDFLPLLVPRALPPNGVDLPSWVNHRTGRFTNGFNLADIIGKVAQAFLSCPNKFACQIELMANADADADAAFLFLCSASECRRASSLLCSKIFCEVRMCAAQHVGFKLSPPAYLSLTPLSNLDDLLRGRVGANYASGGSGILDITGIGTITLREQVQLFAETKHKIIRAGLVGREGLEDLLARSLFVISSGGNDFDAFDYGVPASEAPEFIAGMVATYIKHIKELYTLGARKLAILDMVPVGCLPSQRAITANGDCDADGNKMAEMFNDGLRAEMEKAVAASMPDLRYSIASLYNVLSDMIADPALAGLHEVENACCGGGKFNGEVNCIAGITFLCTDRDEYLFWDKVHGTQAAYRRAVQAFFNGTTRHAEPINLAQLVGSPSSTAPAAANSAI
ncbi:hypothetical protein EJB05_01024, partial [Eragrostis curvula]